VDWNGKTALITGASRGIGIHIVQALSKRGLNIAGVARSADDLKQTRALLQQRGSNFHPFPFDLRETEKLPELVSAIRDQLGSIDFLINNAGQEQYRSYAHVEAEELQSILRTNLLAPMELTRLILPEMIQQGWGHVVNIASLAGKKGVPYNSIYSASKGGLILWSDGLRQELAGTPIHVSVICPGYIAETGMFYNSGRKPPPLLGTSQPQKVAEAVIRALETGSTELIVNSGPIRPLLALNQLFPKLGDWVMKKFGVVALNRERAES